jgi:hypothetical protein
VDFEGFEKKYPDSSCYEEVTKAISIAHQLPSVKVDSIAHKAIGNISIEK